MFIYIILGIGLIVLLYFRSIKDDFAHIPGPKTLPFLGNLLELDVSRAHLKITELADIFGSVFRLYLGSKPVIVVTGLNELYEVLVTKGDSFTSRPFTIRFDKFTSGLSDVVLTSSSKPGWHKLKKFILGHMKGYGSGLRIIEELSRKAVRSQREKMAIQETKVSSIKHDLDTIILKVLYPIIMVRHLYDSREEKEIQELSVFVNAPLEVGGYGEWLDAFPWLRFFGHRDWKHLVESEKRSSKQYQIWKEQVLEDERNGKDVSGNAIYKLLKLKENDSSITEDRCNMVTWQLFFAGILTTSGTLSSLFSILIDRPDIQEKFYEEYQRVIGDRDVTLNDRSDMHYHQATLYEITRLVPVVPLGVPHVANEDTNIGGHAIPMGTEVWPNFWGLQHDKKFWGDPDVFRPERYLDDEGCLVPADHPHRKAHLTFSAGPRVCAGETFAMSRMVIILAELIRAFKFEAPAGQEKFDLHDLVNAIVLSTKPYKVMIKSRDN